MLLLFLAAAHAQDVDPFEEPDESELFALDEALVTVATRYEKAANRAPSVVRVIDAEELREQGHRTLADVLRAVPGLYAWKSKEGRDLVAVRGVISADNNKILLLLDGIPWYDGLYSHALLGDSLPIAHIRQIELIQGPGSAIYGTNAFTAVVNVVTKTGAQLEGGSVRAMLGARGRADVLVQAGGTHTLGSQRLEVSAYGRLLDALGDGLDVTPRARRDVLGFDSKSGLAVGARLRLGDLALQLHHTDFAHTYLVNEADDPFDLLGKDLDDFGLYYQTSTFSARYDLRVGKSLTLRPFVWSQRHNNPGAYSFRTGEGLSDFVVVETEKDTLRWSAGLDLEARPGLDHVTVAGLGLETASTVDGPNGTPGVIDREFVGGATQGQSTGFEASGRLRDTYLYAQHTWTALPELELTGGGRLDMRVPSNPTDDPEAPIFRPNLTPRLGILASPAEPVTVKLLYGRAFRFPSLRELLVRATVRDEDGSFEFANGNPELVPERVDTTELEVVYSPVPGLDLRGYGVYSRVHNEIDKVTPPNAYRNLEGALHVLGTEVGATLDLRSLELGATYALTHARYAEDAGPYAGRLQYEFPPHMVKGHTVLRLGDHLSASALGEVYTYRPRVEWTPNARLEDGQWFGLLHLALRVTDLGRDDAWEVGLSVRNATNTLWGTAMYRDDADAVRDGAARYPREIEGEGRSIHVSVELSL